MGMLTKEDLNQIGELLVKNNGVLKAEIVSEVVEGVGEMIEQNVIPAIDKMGADVKKELRADINRLDTTMQVGFRAIEHRMDRMIDGAPKGELESLRLYPRPTA